MRKNKTIVLLLIILSLATFFRFWQLSSLPPGLWPDEAVNANTAVNIFETKNFEVFYPENHGREGLFFLLISFAFSIFGISLWSFKLTSALAGVLTVLGQYLLSLELSGKRAIALLSAFFLSISFWHINFSRIGFRAILVPLVLTFSLYFFFRGIRTKNIWNFILSGAVFGLGFHTYISFRMAVIPLAFVLIYWLFISIKEGWRNRFLRLSLVFMITMVLVALPIGIYFLKTPGDFISRATGVSVFSQESPIKELIKSTAIHLQMFNFIGDRNLRHNIPGTPQLGVIVGLFFIIGIAWGIKRLITAFREKDFKNSNEIGIISLLIISLFSFILPSALTVEGIPHALRTIGVIPFAYLFAGIGANICYQKMKRSALTKNAFYLLLIFITISSFYSYFFCWGKNSEIKNAFTVRFYELGKELNDLPLETNKYVIKSEGDLPTEVIKFTEKTVGRSDNAVFIDSNQIQLTEFTKGDIIFTMNKEIAPLNFIREHYPEGTLYERDSFWIYELR